MLAPASDALTGPSRKHAPLDHIRSDNGPACVATAFREWRAKVGVKTPYIEPGSPWEDTFMASRPLNPSRSAPWRSGDHSRSEYLIGRVFHHRSKLL